MMKLKKAHAAGLINGDIPKKYGGKGRGLIESVIFLLKKNLDFYATMCHISINVCKNEEKLLERLDQAILGVIDKPEKTQQTTAIGTLF